MRTRQVVLAALAAAVTLTSSASGGRDAAMQRVTITTQAAKPIEVSPFVLIPLRDGAIKGDSGTVTSPFPPERVVLREGQRVSIFDAVATYKGKRGTLKVRYRTEWVDAGNGYRVGSSTWKVVRGTGQYARFTGGGRGGDVSLARGPWSSRAEGFLTVP